VTSASAIAEQTAVISSRMAHLRKAVVLQAVQQATRAQPLLFRVGHVITLAGVPFRICKVLS
jgi:hypothetical protein